MGRLAAPRALPRRRQERLSDRPMAARKLPPEQTLRPIRPRNPPRPGQHPQIRPGRRLPRPPRTQRNHHDPREALAHWMTDRKNPFFAQAAVNRVWAELMGRGLVQPVDDFRISNPPTNEPLLRALAGDFVEHGYDIKQLVRTIMRSRAY